MRENAHLGVVAVANLLNRTPASVRSAAQRHRISLRRPGYRGGVVLGQSRGISLRKAQREALLEYGTLIAERMRIDEQAELCPSCGRRPQRVSTTGLCAVCHKQRLADAHRETVAELEAQRGLWMERQRLHRARQEPET